jgi:hypothetical protein
MSRLMHLNVMILSKIECFWGINHVHFSKRRSKMKSLMKVIPKIGYLCFFLVWFSACGEEAGPLSDDSVPTTDEVSVDQQALGIKTGHFHLNKIAFDWLKDHGMALAGLNLQEINYGDMFADHPEIGRRESFIPKDYPTPADYEPADPENEKGTATIGYRDDLAETEPYHANCGSFGQMAVILKWVKNPNLYLRLQVSYPEVFLFGSKAETVPVAGAVHYMNESWGTGLFDGNMVRLFWSNIRGLEFFTGLFDMAQRFYEYNSILPKPKLTDLTRVSYPGQIFLHNGDLPGGLVCGENLISDLGPIFIGGNPFINTPTTATNWSQGPTWPIWAPNVLDSKAKLVQPEVDKSNRVSANYLGWALHMVQDMLTVFHAHMEIGDLHSAFETAFVNFRPWAPKGDSASRFSDIFAGTTESTNRFKARLPEICENYTHYFHQAYEYYATDAAYNLAKSAAQKYKDYNYSAVTTQEKALFEKMADDQLKFTILAMACLNKMNTKPPSKPSFTSFNTEVETCPSNSLTTGIRCWGEYCRVVGLECLTNPSFGLDGAYYWTDKFSEEGASTGNNYRTCRDGYFVTGTDCTGDYCDNISLRCSHVTSGYHIACYWEPTRISEENVGGIYARDGYYVAGLMCEGSNCDYKRIYACQNPMLGKPNLYAPATYGATNSTPTFQWYPVPNATDYAIETTGVSKNSTIISAVDAKCSNGLCSISPNWVMPAGTENWKVQARNWWAGNGAFTDWSSFTVYTAAPGKPTLTYPTGTITTENPIYSWNAATNATEYVLGVFNDKGTLIAAKSYSSAEACKNSTSCSVSSPATVGIGNGTFNWQVYALNPVNNNPSVAMQFSVNVTKPTLVLPYSGAVVTTKKPIYYWIRLPTAVKYRLAVVDNNWNFAVIKDLSPKEAGCDTQTVCFYQPDVDLLNGEWNWNVLYSLTGVNWDGGADALKFTMNAGTSGSSGGS